MNAILMEGLGFGLVAVYAVFIIAMFWLMGRPQKKEQKRLQALMASLAVGDTIKTTSGFYGVVIDITDDMVIVEFGNNKNCRIPMDKAAITDVEKPEE
jgi:preprotein translocase subunit YajC